MMTEEELDRIVNAIRSIASGNTSGPDGLEAVAMSLGGEGPPGKNDSVASGLHDVAESIRELAEAIEGSTESGADTIAESLDKINNHITALEP